MESAALGVRLLVEETCMNRSRRKRRKHGVAGTLRGGAKHLSVSMQDQSLWLARG